MVCLLLASSCWYSGFSRSGYVWTNAFVVCFPSPVVVPFVQVFSALWDGYARCILVASFPPRASACFQCFHLFIFQSARDQIIALAKDSHSCFSLPPCLGLGMKSLYNQHGIIHAISRPPPRGCTVSYAVCFREWFVVYWILTLKIWKYYCRVRQYVLLSNKNKI